MFDYFSFLSPFSLFVPRELHEEALLLLLVAEAIVSTILYYHNSHIYAMSFRSHSQASVDVAFCS